MKKKDALVSYRAKTIEELQELKIESKKIIISKYCIDENNKKLIINQIDKGIKIKAVIRCINHLFL